MEFGLPQSCLRDLLLECMFGAIRLDSVSPVSTAELKVRHLRTMVTGASIVLHTRVPNHQLLARLYSHRAAPS